MELKGDLCLVLGGQVALVEFLVRLAWLMIIWLIPVGTASEFFGGRSGVSVATPVFLGVNYRYVCIGTGARVALTTTAVAALMNREGRVLGRGNISTEGTNVDRVGLFVLLRPSGLRFGLDAGFFLSPWSFASAFLGVGIFLGLLGQVMWGFVASYHFIF